MKEITITKEQFEDKVSDVVAKSVDEMTKEGSGAQMALLFMVMGALIASKLQKEFFGEEPKESEQEKEPKEALN